MRVGSMLRITYILGALVICYWVDQSVLGGKYSFQAATLPGTWRSRLIAKFEIYCVHSESRTFEGGMESIGLICKLNDITDRTLSVEHTDEG